MKRYSELQVGITVILAIIVLVAGILWFKGFSMDRDMFRLDVFVSQASGLAKGDPVEVAGVVQGKVDEITYEGGRARLML
jgi:ABC-type transporter Mla subunit MlaD